ncbi:MAG TPA: hypothetical protein VFV87_01460 [Pirellulaceae bacterium]|nr:hypothetical protein [Pirellulaceae bacterium]
MAPCTCHTDRLTLLAPDPDAMQPQPRRFDQESSPLTAVERSHQTAAAPAETVENLSSRIQELAGELELLCLRLRMLNRQPRA